MRIHISSCFVKPSDAIKRCSMINTIAHISQHKAELLIKTMNLTKLTFYVSKRTLKTRLCHILAKTRLAFKAHSNMQYISSYSVPKKTKTVFSTLKTNIAHSCRIILDYFCKGS